MKTLLLSLCVFVCSQHTEGVTDQQVTLGQRVTLTCELRLKDVIWFVIKPSVRPVMILRTFGSNKAEYYNKEFRKKYSKRSRSQLIINNVAIEDLGTYYCIKPDWDLQISDGIRLDTEAPQVSNEPVQKNPPQDQRAHQILIVTLTLLMVLLFAAVVGLLIMNRKLSRKIPRYANFQEILDRRITSTQTNGTIVPPQNPLTDHEYLEVLPNSA